MIKEEQIKENLKDISEMENKISVLENENENLKNHIAESGPVLKRYLLFQGAKEEGGRRQGGKETA